MNEISECLTAERFIRRGQPETWRNGLIVKRDVADFLLREIITPSLFRVAPALTY